MFYNSLSLGLHSAPYYFSEIAGALNFICVSNGVEGHLINILDDFLILSSSEECCACSLDVVIAAKCGFSVKPSKTKDPCRKLEVLGIVIDVVRRCLQITDERLTYVRSEMMNWKGLSKCTKRELLYLLGTLNFCSQVIKYSQLL